MIQFQEYLNIPSNSNIKKKTNFWRIQDLQFNLIKRTAYMYIHFWSPVASCEHGTIVNRGRDVGGTTYFSPFSTCVERKSGIGKRRYTYVVAERERQRILAKYRGVGVSRERRFGVGGARRRKTDQRSQ